MIYNILGCVTAISVSQFPSLPTLALVSLFRTLSHCVHYNNFGKVSSAHRRKLSEFTSKMNMLMRHRILFEKISFVTHFKFCDLAFFAACRLLSSCSSSSCLLLSMHEYVCILFFRNLQSVCEAPRVFHMQISHTSPLHTGSQMDLF